MAGSDGGGRLFSLEEVKELAGGVDFIAALIGLVAGSLNSFHKSLIELPKKFPSLDILKLMNDSHNSLYLMINISAFGPSEDCKDKNEIFWNSHLALTVYQLECLILATHSVLSAFTGHYTVAYTELRSALESAVIGGVLDLLAITQYRKNAKILVNIKGFIKGGKKASSFKELIERLDEKYDGRRIENSSEILELIETELKDFNPKHSFIKLLNQLKDWKIIDEEMHEVIKNVYITLSEYVHRVRPISTETVMRLLVNKDLFPLEPIPERLEEFLKYFVEINGLTFYLLLKTLWRDLQDPAYIECLGIEKIGGLIEGMRELAEKGYAAWRRNLVEAEQLLKLTASAGAKLA